jgi:hypothetical protein
MLRIPREVIEHKLGIATSYKSVKQKERIHTQRGEKSCSKKSINYSKLGSLGQ